VKLVANAAGSVHVARYVEVTPIGLFKNVCLTSLKVVAFGFGGAAATGVGVGASDGAGEGVAVGDGAAVGDGGFDVRADPAGDGDAIEALGPVVGDTLAHDVRRTALTMTTNRPAWTVRIGSPC